MARRPRIAAAVAVGLAVAFVAWLILRDSGPDARPQRAPAIAMNLAQLRGFAAAADRPVFWAGPVPAGLPDSGVTYEVTQTGDGSIYLRYLPPGVSAGVEQEHLTVGTYLDGQADRTVRQASQRPGAMRSQAPGGRTAVSNSSYPKSVYLAAPSGRQLIEVFDPDPARARRVASTVRPIR